MGPLRLAHPTICLFGFESFCAIANEQGISKPEISCVLMCRFVFGLREFIRFVGVGCALKTVLLCEPFVRCRHSGVFEPEFRGDGGLSFGLCA